MSRWGKVENLVVWASHSSGSIDVLCKEGDAMGLNKFRLKNILEKH
jgi:hypothetical protein